MMISIDGSNATVSQNAELRKAHNDLYRRLRRETLVLTAVYLAPTLTVAMNAPSASSVHELFGHLRGAFSIVISHGALALLTAHLLYTPSTIRHSGESATVDRPRAFAPAQTAVVFLMLAVLAVGFNTMLRVMRPGDALSAHTTVPTSMRSAFGSLPFVIVAMLTVAYAEELFFRAYLSNRLALLGVSRLATIVAGAALFAVGHLYQGLAAAVFALLAGVVLMWWWQRRPLLHAFAIGHACYNVAAWLLWAV